MKPSDRGGISPFKVASKIHLAVGAKFGPLVAVTKS